MTGASLFEDESIVDALSILANSSNVSLQMSAAVGFCEALENVDIKKISFKMLKPILHLLMSESVGVQGNALVALCKLAENSDNALLIVRYGALIPLIRVMISSPSETLYFAACCLNLLAKQDRNKEIIARSGSLVPLLNLSQSKDVEVQEHCLRPAKLGEIDPNRVELADSLITLSDSIDIRVRKGVAIVLGSLASEGYFRNKIVGKGGLKSLHKLLLSTDQVTILGSLICINQISDRPQYQSQLIDGGFLARLKELLAYDEVEEIRYRAAFTLSRLAIYGEPGRVALVEAGVVECARILAQDASPTTQALLTIMICNLTCGDSLRLRLMSLGMPDILVCCTTSSHREARVNAMYAINVLLMKFPDHQPFVEVWEAPAGSAELKSAIKLVSEGISLGVQIEGVGDILNAVVGARAVLRIME
ncbi:Vacuolar protein 8 [Entomortierella chlamydospora]|uniref:Vacuolar protein 8 n=1 Tax=Entomortierella chlamydospora TaxID=101097 RepID=A0A9P6N086_9FUNG|nr:Vacuolar protein 8 [Entomortierella chlamydospora]